MIDASKILTAIDQATREVFSMMLDVELSPETHIDCADPYEGGVVSLVGLTGNWSGTGTMSCSPVEAAIIASKMLLVDSPETAVDEDVLDAVAELTNMIVGNIKNHLSEYVGEMAISIPTVVYGRNFRFRSFSGMAQSSVVFKWEDHTIEVKICLAPTLESSPVRERLAHPAFSAD